MGWIGVDLDGTLAEYNGWNNGQIGKPIEPMAARVREWLAQGKSVKIFTARVGIQLGAYSLESKQEASAEFAAEQTRLIQDWTEKHFGVRLDVTNQKTFDCDAIWDDRAVTVVFNTGDSILHCAQELRELQKEYFQTRSQKILNLCRIAERRFDWLVEKVFEKQKK